MPHNESLNLQIERECREYEAACQRSDDDCSEGVKPPHYGTFTPDPVFRAYCESRDAFAAMSSVERAAALAEGLARIDTQFRAVR